MAKARESQRAMIVLEADNLAARAVIPAGVDPDTVTPEALTALARERGVQIDACRQQALAEIAADFEASPAPIDRVFARAEPPEPGRDARIEWRPGHDPNDPAGGRPPEADDDGRVDHYARQAFVRVHAGDLVATVHPATPGKAGRDVTGLVIAPTPGAALPLTLDASLRLLPDGRVFADRDGRLRFQGSMIIVDPVLEIEGTVDFHTGHVEFDGDVHIHHDIRDRFRVKAAGRLAVNGLVDSCHLECSKDLVAPRGIAGRGEGTINVGRNALVGYLDQVRGNVGQTLNFSKSIRRCTLAIGGDLIGAGGAVVAGVTTVAGNVRVGELGSESETPTELRLAALPGSGGRAAAGESTVEVLRMIHPMVSLTIGAHSITFTQPVKGPIRLWLGAQGLMYRMGQGDAQPIKSLAGATSRPLAA